MRAFGAARKAADEVFVEVPGAAGPERVEYDRQCKLGLSEFNSKPEKVGACNIPWHALSATLGVQMQF